MSDTFEKNHLPAEDEQPTLSENNLPEVDEEEEDYDEPQPWMDEFEYIDWLISHRQDAVIMLTGGLYFIFSDAEIAESAFEMVQDVCDAAMEGVKNEWNQRSNWSRFLIRDDNVLYVDGDKPSVLGKYEASKTDIGANLFQKICMALARRWPENTFSGRGGFTYPSSGAEHGMIVEFKDGVLRYNILWMKNSDLREVCDRRFMERSALVSSGFPQMPTGPHALRHKKLSACMPSRSCRNACCMVTAEEQIYELKGDHFWLKEKRAFNEL